MAKVIANGKMLGHFEVLVVSEISGTNNRFGKVQSNNMSSNVLTLTPEAKTRALQIKCLRRIPQGTYWGMSVFF